MKTEKGFTLGAALGGEPVQDELVSYTAGVTIQVAAKGRKDAELAARKLGWDHALANAALNGKGTEACPYCAALSQLLKASGKAVPTGIVLEYDLPTVDRGGKFSIKKGVKTNADHLTMHINRASDELFKERQVRKFERSIKAMVSESVDASSPEGQAVEDEVRRERKAGRRKGGRFTSPDGHWKGGHRSNPRPK